MKESTGVPRLFYTLLQAGLWERRISDEPWLKFCDDSSIYWRDIYRLAEEQNVVGLITAGLDYLTEFKAPQEIVLQFVGASLQIEKRNLAMNLFIAKTVEDMSDEGIYTVLVKGQGIAQCYNRPLWRSCGDIDLFFSRDDYAKAVKQFLIFTGAKIIEDAHYTKSLGVVSGQWLIELHGTLRNGLSTKMDRVIDIVQDNIFQSGNVREWKNGNTTVMLPGIDDDVFLVFAHFVRHFYKEGVCLRQICDWCRLLWTYSEQINVGLLENRLIKAGLMCEWRAFAALAVEYIGMPIDVLPLYDKDKKWSLKADKIIELIIKGRKYRKLQNTIKVGNIFPLSTLRFASGILLNVNWLKIKEKLFKKD